MKRNKYTVKTIEPQELDFEKNWTSYIYRKKVGIKNHGLIEFSKIGCLKRGIATGNNDFFTLTREDAQKRGIIEHTRPVLRSARYIDGYVFSSNNIKNLEEKEIPTRLLYIDENTAITEDLEKYLEKGRKEGVHEAYLCQNRNPWYRVERRDPPPAFVTYMGREEPRFILNKAESLYLNNCHGLYLNKDLGLNRLKAFLLFLNTFFDKDYIRGYSKSYSGGMFKIEPEDLKKTEVVDFSNLSPEKIDKMANLFDNLDVNFNRDKMKGYVNDIVEE